MVNINDDARCYQRPLHGTERGYNALRLAHTLLKNDMEAEVTIFLMADAVVAARKGLKTPDGCHKMERKLKRVVARAALQFRRRDSSRHFRRGPDLR